MKRALLLIALVDCMPDTNSTSIEIDLRACRDESISQYLPLGSIYIDVEPLSPYVCQLTLGGETENPSYDGSASQRCFFYRFGSVAVDVRSGGPAYIDNSSNCVDI